MAGGLQTHWTLTMMRSWVIVIYIGSTCCTGKYNTYWYGDNPTGSYHVFSNNNTDFWWNTAQNGCRGGRLFVPHSMDVPLSVVHLQRNKSYWMGALQYSVWRWTDGTPLYTYAGYRRIGDSVHRLELYDNSALQCHLRCKDSKLIGLRGRECYCISDAARGQPEKPEMRCPGNYNEKCGNADGISLYIMDTITMEPKRTSHCVYADLRKLFRLTFHQDDNCDEKRSAACTKDETESTGHRQCRQNICIPSGTVSWRTANRTCNLIKITQANKGDLREAMSYSFLGEKRYTYWIGLERIKIRKWLDGRKVSMQTEDKLSTEPLCLAIHVSASGERHLDWRSCLEQMSAVCEQYTTSTADWSPASEHTNTLPYAPSTARTLAGVDSGTKRLQQDKRHQMITLGVSVAAVILAIVFISLIVTYRKKKACFRRHSPGTFLYLDRTSRHQPPNVQACESHYLTVVHNQETTNFGNCDHMEGESQKMLKNDSKSHCKEKEQNETNNHLSENRYDVASAVGSGSFTASARAVADDTMGTRWGRNKPSDAQDFGDTQHDVMVQKSHAVIKSIVCDEAEDWKYRKTKPKGSMHNRTLSNDADEYYDMAGSERPRAPNDEYVYMNQGKLAGGNMKGLESRHAMNNTSSSHKDPIYGNDQVSASTTTASPPESVYYNVKLA